MHIFHVWIETASREWTPKPIKETEFGTRFELFRQVRCAKCGKKKEERLTYILPVRYWSLKGEK